MRDKFGRTLARIHRKDIETGKAEPPKDTKASKLVKSIGGHYYSLVKLLRPGKLNGLWLIEMKPSQLANLIELERERGSREATQKHLAVAKKAAREIAAMKEKIDQQEKQLKALRKTSAKAVQRTDLVEMQLAKAKDENTEMWSENGRLESLCQDALSRLSSLRQHFYGKDEKITQLSSDNERQRQTIIDLNARLAPLEGDKEDRSPYSATVKTQQSTVKVTSSKPLDGPYGANQ